MGGQRHLEEWPPLGGGHVALDVYLCSYESKTHQSQGTSSALLTPCHLLFLCARWRGTSCHLEGHGREEESHLGRYLVVPRLGDVALERADKVLRPGCVFSVGTGDVYSDI